MTRGTTRQTLAAADALHDWLQTKRPRPAPPSAAVAPALATADLPQADLRLAATVLPAARPAQAIDPETTVPLRLPHTDWLYHRLTVRGPREPLAGLRAAAAGAGVIPWQLDLDRMGEDLFHALVAPPAPHRRRLSLSGARILAGQLRDAVARRHALAVARVGQSRACPFDLQALPPMPPDLLVRGPDDPAALAWLWTQWGTTEALRQVTVVTAAFPDEPAAPVPGEAALPGDLLVGRPDAVAGAGAARCALAGAALRGAPHLRGRMTDAIRATDPATAAAIAACRAARGLTGPRC